MHESQLHSDRHFVTLTYDGSQLPEHGSLDPEDLRLFWRRLRSSQPGRVSYYACGEYGEIGYRPHYHAVVFGASLDNDLLEEIWGHGQTDLGSVTFGSASYVAGYVQKKVLSRDNPDQHTRVDRETGELVEVVPEFARMSNRPAIGRRWIERYWKDVYPRDYVVVNGTRAKPPRYYDKFMDEEHPEMMESVRQKRFEEMEELDRHQLRSMEINHQAKADLFSTRRKV